MKIREDFPFDPITSIAQVKLGDAYFEKTEYLLAAGVYEDFFNAHPEDENTPYVLRRLGESYAHLSPTIDRDQAYTVKAIERFTYLKNRYPQSSYAKDVDARIDELTEKQAAHELYVAEYYHKTERYNASILRLDYFLTKYPKAKNRDKALFLLTDCYRKLDDPQKSRFNQEQLKKEYPKSIYARSAVRHTTADKPKDKTEKASITQTDKTIQKTGKAEKREAITFVDAGTSPKRKEIDLRPPAADQGKAATAAAVAPASASKNQDLSGEAAPAGVTPVSAPGTDKPAGKDDNSVAGSKPTGKQSGTETPVIETPKAGAGSPVAPKPAAVKKDDQKKGPLGFFSTEKKPIDVVSDNMEGLDKGKVIIFKGNVVAVQGDLQMFSDTLTAYLGEETNEIEKAVAKGHVKIIKPDRIATCEDAVFENAKGEITLTGNVVVFSGPNKVAGDIVKYFINEDRVSVESEKGKKAHVTVHPKQ